MSKFAMVFPGQGSQAVGMLADLRHNIQSWKKPSNKQVMCLAMTYGI